MIRIVAFSDTHGSHMEVKLPEGDILVCAGDICPHGQLKDVEAFINWFGVHPHKHKVFIAGNHDRPFESDPGVVDTILKNMPEGMHYLQDSGVELMGLKFWGSPVSPRFFNWSFNRDRGEDIKRHWDMIPNDTDVLITHGPPYGVCDEAYRFGSNATEKVGCKDLLDVSLRVAPKLHVFGHIHYSGGTSWVAPKTTYANVSVLNENYTVEYKPQVFEFDFENNVSIVD